MSSTIGAISSNNNYLDEVRIDVDIKNFQLSTLDDKEIQHAVTWCCGSRHARNITRAFLSGGLTSIGALVASYYTTPTGIVVGGALGGIANGLSTILAKETKSEHLIVSRMIKDLSLVSNSLFSLERQTTEMIQRIEKVTSTKIQRQSQEEDLSIFVLDEAKWYCNSRVGGNWRRLFFAGGLSTVGAWVGGFLPTHPGIVIGAFLSGLGNAASTWLTYQKSNEQLIKNTALTKLPELVKIIQEGEEKLSRLITKIAILFPQTMDNSQLELTVIPEKDLEDQIENVRCCLLGTRERRNFVYVNAAGWLSAIGAWISGVSPNVAGILSGGAIGGLANGISTWLAWEKPHAKEIEHIVVNVFPSLFLRALLVSVYIKNLSSFIEKQEKQMLS